MSVVARGRTLIYSNCLDETPELTKLDVDFHNIDFELQKGEGIFINIEDERITIGPVSTENSQAILTAKAEGNKI